MDPRAGPKLIPHRSLGLAQIVPQHEGQVGCSSPGREAGGPCAFHLAPAAAPRTVHRFGQLHLQKHSLFSVQGSSCSVHDCAWPAALAEALRFSDGTEGREGGLSPWSMSGIEKHSKRTHLKVMFRERMSEIYQRANPANVQHRQALCRCDTAASHVTASMQKVVPGSCGRCL